MTRIGVLHDDLAALGGGLGAGVGELEAAVRALRDLQLDQVAPGRAASVVDTALTRLARRLESLADEAADGSRVVARELAEPPRMPERGRHEA
jgi:hypothetical protein